MAPAAGERGRSAAEAQRHTVYLKRSAERVTAEQVLASIRAVEWDLVTEACGAPMARISEADENLRIENVRPPAFIRHKLDYRPGASAAGRY